MKYRKGPVVVSAEQFFPEREPWPEEVETRSAFWLGTEEPIYVIRTLEGWMRVSPGDWIITSIKGEKYPCRDDIFKETYEAEGLTVCPGEVGRLVPYKTDGADGTEMRAGEEWVAVNKKRLDNLEARVSNLTFQRDNRQARLEAAEALLKASESDIKQAIRAQAFREAAEICESRAFDFLADVFRIMAEVEETNDPDLARLKKF